MVARKANTAATLNHHEHQGSDEEETKSAGHLDGASSLDEPTSNKHKMNACNHQTKQPAVTMET